MADGQPLRVLDGIPLLPALDGTLAGMRKALVPAVRIGPFRPLTCVAISTRRTVGPRAFPLSFVCVVALRTRVRPLALAGPLLP